MMHRTLGILGILTGILFVLVGVQLLRLTYGFSALILPVSEAAEYWLMLVSNLVGPRKGLLGVALGSTFLVMGVILLRLGGRTLWTVED
jgi:hypothetical protein